MTLVALALCLPFVSCTTEEISESDGDAVDGDERTDGDGLADGDGDGGACAAGAYRCLGDVVERCESGAWAFLHDCFTDGLTCFDGGCVAITPTDGDSTDGDNTPDGDILDSDASDGDDVPDDDIPDGDGEPDGDVPDGDASDGDIQTDGDHADGDITDGDQPTDGDVDFLCARPDAGPDQTVRPLDTVNLDGTGSTDSNGAILAYKWEWESKPAEAFSAIIRDSQGHSVEGIWTESAQPLFFAAVAGTYVVRLTLQDADEDCNEALADTVTITAIPDDDIHIELTWSQANNDHDLHLIRPGGQHSRDCDGAGNQSYCCWQNCNTMNGSATPCPPRGCPGPQNAPDWGQIEIREDDPRLDIDDITGRGPEETNLSQPEIGDYLVTVENYSGDSKPEATVSIWLFGELRDTFTRPDGFSPRNHWNVCWLRVNGPEDIEIVPIDTVEPSGSRGSSINRKALKK